MEVPFGRNAISRINGGYPQISVLCTFKCYDNNLNLFWNV